jgi:hypothetical protein
MGVSATIAAGIYVLQKLIMQIIMGIAVTPESQPAIAPGLFSAVLSVSVVILLGFGNIINQRAINIYVMDRQAAKRWSINADAGAHIKSISLQDDRVAVPNIGYIGFFSERFIVDLVGLVTPDASLALSPDEWRSWDPRFYMDKAIVAERLLAIDGYEFRAVLGPEHHRSERFVLLERSGVGGDSVLLDVNLRQDLNRRNSLLLGDTVNIRESLDGKKNFYLSFYSDDCSPTTMTLKSSGKLFTATVSYQTRDSWNVFRLSQLEGVDFKHLESIEVGCDAVSAGGVLKIAASSS